MGSSWNRRMKEMGLCPLCGKNEPSEGKTVCELCCAKRRKYYRPLHILEQRLFRRMAGMCEECGMDHHVPGERICQYCRDMDLSAWRLKAQRKPPKSVEVNPPHLCRPLVVWSLQRGPIREHLPLTHAKFVAELWNRQDNPIESKPMSMRESLCQRWPRAS